MDRTRQTENGTTPPKSGTKSDAFARQGRWVQQSSYRTEDLLQRSVVVRHTAFEARELSTDFGVEPCRITQSDKARTTNTLISTARELFKTDAAMMAPCSVNAMGA